MQAAETNTRPTLNAREISVKSHALPLHRWLWRLPEAKTLDPAEIAHECWKGYLTHQPDAWGMSAGLRAELRFNFDDRLLPWPVLKHHAVDGFGQQRAQRGRACIAALDVRRRESK